MKYRTIKVIVICVFFVFFLSCERNKEYNYLEIIDNLVSEYEDLDYGFDLIQVDCDNQNSIYLQLYQDDQQVRTSEGDMLAVDEKNFITLVSLIEQCGWPQFTPLNKGDRIPLKEWHSRSSVFLIIQHSNPERIGKLYKKFKESVEIGVFPKTNLALLQDRFLMHHDKPQVYGSQIQSGRLFSLWNPSEVNNRRKEIGLEPIENYLDRFSLNFEDEINFQKNNSK